MSRYTKEGLFEKVLEDSQLCSKCNALPGALPFFARVIGNATSFSYQQGVLCTLNENVIQIHTPSATQEIKLSNVLEDPLENYMGGPTRITLKHYCDGIISVLCQEMGKKNNDRIFAISSEKNQVIKTIKLESSRRLFVRNTSRYLCYGTYTALEKDDAWEWRIWLVSFDGKGLFPASNQPLRLKGYHGIEIGREIAFEIHGDYLYVVSLCSVSKDICYRCKRFSLNRTEPATLDIDKEVFRHFRAELAYGSTPPGAHLSIQVDRRGRPIIVDSRLNQVPPSRAEYWATYTVDFPIDQSMVKRIRDDHCSMRPVRTWNASAPEYPVQWSVHPGFFADSSVKFRAYNYFHRSFLDLIEDKDCCGGSQAPPCVRVRIGSRKDDVPGWDLLSRSVDENVVDRFSTVRMWPPPASTCPCSQRLHQILNPPLSDGPTKDKTYSCALDEHGLVYMIFFSDGSALGVKGIVVHISFDRGVQNDSPLRHDWFAQ